MKFKLVPINWTLAIIIVHLENKLKIKLIINKLSRSIGRVRSEPIKTKNILSFIILGKTTKKN
jgi:hypothetical protein